MSPRHNHTVGTVQGLKGWVSTKRHVCLSFLTWAPERNWRDFAWYPKIREHNSHPARGSKRSRAQGANQPHAAVWTPPRGCQTTQPHFFFYIYVSNGAPVGGVREISTATKGWCKQKPTSRFFPILVMQQRKKVYTWTNNILQVQLRKISLKKQHPKAARQV